ncbi:hypothetical protein [Micromonospora sp. WMMD1082]|uniref:hypothetical protein n=1 Tax=Micromonospora sp. WMMD1082 TaxID=3016104 RepID=UPI002418074F|nr:hypothetical protein [Micromonospora sp. WMMD1082]MDG4793715.1 hypothetical protein [Micromonospora sp. WMMD1082]
MLPRVAFYGRTAEASDLATATRVLGGQYQRCVSVLPDGAITAVFSDLGTRPDYQRTPASLFLDTEREISRDGGLNDLLTEANRPARRFDFVISTDVHRLSRHTTTSTVLLRTFAVAGIEFLHAPEIRDGDRRPVMPWRLRSVEYINVLTQLIRDGGYR